MYICPHIKERPDVYTVDEEPTQKPQNQVNQLRMQVLVKWPFGYRITHYEAGVGRKKEVTANRR